jgi:hypothetical protein
MLELATLIVLSILFTFFALVFSHIMMKILGIHHPRNRFWVYSMALMTAFSIFSFIGIGMPFHTDGQIEDVVVDQVYEQSSHLAIIEGEIDIENNNFSSCDAVIVSPIISSRINKTDSCSDVCRFGFIFAEQGQYIQLIPDSRLLENYDHDVSENHASGNCCGDNADDRSSIQEKLVIASSVFSQNSTGLFSQIFSKYCTLFPLSGADFGVREEKDGAGSDKVVGGERVNFKNNAFDYVSLFLGGNLFLLVICILYLILGFAFGKRYTLKGINARRCRDPALLGMIKELSKELKISPPRVYVFDGAPNAFVFGYPVSLAVSKELIRCLSKKELRITMRHELAHIKNRDIVIKPLLQVLRILFFYNPAVHLLYHMIVKERELLADRLYLNSTKEKVIFMEALVKIHEYTKRHSYLSQADFRSYSLSLMTHNPRTLEIEDRFNHLFAGGVKKTFCSIFICLVVLGSNLSLVTVAQSVLFNSSEYRTKQKMETVEINPERADNNHHPIIRYIYIFREDPCSFREFIIYHTNISFQEND